MLHNGVKMPTIGIGTYQCGGQTLYNSLIAALQHGVRHIDTARMYKVPVRTVTHHHHAHILPPQQNEAVVAAAVRDSGAQDVFITSKISPYEVCPSIPTTTLRKPPVPPARYRKGPCSL